MSSALPSAGYYHPQSGENVTHPSVLGPVVLRGGGSLKL